MLNRRELGALRKKLPEKGYQKIAERTGYTSSMVGKTLRDPKHFNATIINKALEVIEEYRHESNDLKNKVKQITS